MHKESSDPEYSGYGIDFKLKKSDTTKRKSKWLRLLQYKDIFLKTGKVVLPEEYIYTKQAVGIDAHQKSKLTAFLDCSR